MNILKLSIALIVSFCFGELFLVVAPDLFKNPAMLLSLPVIFIFVILLITRPIVLIYIILGTRVAIDPFLQSSKSGTGMGAGAILNFLVILTAILICSKNIKKILAIPYLKGWLIFLLVTFIAVLYSPVRMTGFRSWLNNLSYFSMAVIPFCCISSTKDVQRWIVFIACSSFLPTVLALGYGAIHHMLFSRIYYPAPHPSVLAHCILILLMSVAFAILFFVSKKTILYNFLKFNMLLQVVVLILTQTRNVWISCWSCFVIFGFMTRRKVLLFLLFVLPLLSLSLPIVQERLADAFTNQEQTASHGMNSFAWRVALWKDSFPWIFNKPLFGHGVSSFMYYSPDFSKLIRPPGMMAHNVYIELLFEAGIFGVLSFVLIFFLLFKDLLFYFKNIKNKKAKGIVALMFAYVIGYLINCYIDNLQSVLVANWYVWFIMGALYKYLMISYEQEQENRATQQTA